MRKKTFGFAERVFGLLMILGAWGSDAAAQTAAPEIIRNPKNPVAPSGGPSQLILKEDLVIGKQGGPDGDLFAELRSIGLDDQENIWTLDWEDIKIRIFDKTGKLTATFGKKGQGPNELQNPQRMIVTGDGRAAILDLNKLAFYSAEGRCLKELSTAKARTFRYKIDRWGFIYFDSWDLGPKQVWKITKFDAELNPLKTFPILEEPFVMGTVSLFTPILYFHVTRDGRLIWAFNSKYEFTVLDAEGRQIRKIFKDYEPRKIFAAEQKKLLQDRFGGNEYALKPKINIPPAYQPLVHFIGDDDGRVFARTTETDGKGGTWTDVFDPQGRWLTRFSLPEDETIFIVKKEKLYTMISEDEEGRPLVKRYAMTWK